MKEGKGDNKCQTDKIEDKAEMRDVPQSDDPRHEESDLVRIMPNAPPPRR
jgi:hypothetical protein